MRYILTAEQMKKADERMIQKIGIPSLVLMERAALQCVAVMKEEKTDLSRALIVCGSGNNGGDGFVIARLLAEENYEVDVAFVGNSSSRSEETKIQMEILEKLGVIVGNCLPEKEYSVIIDAVFGIGLSREISGNYRNVIEKMNSYKGCKVAVDIPSGISADTGRVLGCAFRADLTVTFAYVKAGQISYPGCEYCGKVMVRQIGIYDPALEERKDVFYTLEPADVFRRMPKRIPDSNKGTYGKVLLIAGSRGMAGAAYMSAASAYMAGAGLVRIYTDESNRAILQQQIPEAILTTYDSKENEPFGELDELLAWADVVCLGSGLGMSKASRKLVVQVLKKNRRICVLDADGLNIVASLSEEELKNWKKESEQYIITPHMKEMSRLTGYSVEELKENRTEYVNVYVRKHHVICALKDSRTIVAAENRQTFLNMSGNSAMAKAGSGDVLAGLITGLVAQNMLSYDAAVLGVYLHGLAGDMARKKCGAYSVMARDIIQGIKEVLTMLEEQQNEDLQ